MFGMHIPNDSVTRLCNFRCDVLQLFLHSVQVLYSNIGTYHMHVNEETNLIEILWHSGRDTACPSVWPYYFDLVFWK